MSDLPSGTVTFLFTDIEGSTERWERDRAAMAAPVERHRVITPFRFTGLWQVPEMDDPGARSIPGASLPGTRPAAWLSVSRYQTSAGRNRQLRIPHFGRHLAPLACRDARVLAATRQTPSSPSHTYTLPFPTFWLTSTVPEQPVASKKSAAAPSAESDIR